jgi:hypothetical protein
MMFLANRIFERRKKRPREPWHLSCSPIARIDQLVTRQTDMETLRSKYGQDVGSVLTTA